MILSDLHALTPYVVMVAGLLLQLLVVSFWRRPGVSAAIAVITLGAALTSLLVDGGAGSPAVRNVFVLDGMTGLFNGLFLIAAILTALFMHLYLRGRSGRHDEFFLLLVTATLGAMTLVAAQHFTVLLLGLEILSVSLYVMIGYPDTGHPPLEAALKYLVLSGVASTTLLFGMALVYLSTGALDFAGIDAAADDTLIMGVGQTMMLAGLAFKLSLVPFHMWTPDVYEGAPAPVSAYLATVAKGAVLILLLRYAEATDVLSTPAGRLVLAVLAGLSMVVGNLLALLQNNLKRLLAYSSIAHLGYLMIAAAALPLLVDGAIALESAGVYLCAYFAMTLAAFGVVSLMSDDPAQEDAAHLDRYEGLFWRHPLAAAVLTVAMLALAGIPLTIGFVAKFYLLTTGIDSGLWLLVWALILGSAMAIYYYLRVIIMMARPLNSTVHRRPDPGAMGMSALAALGVVVVAAGVYPMPLINLVRTTLGLP